MGPSKAVLLLPPLTEVGNDFAQSLLDPAIFTLQTFAFAVREHSLDVRETDLVRRESLVSRNERLWGLTQRSLIFYRKTNERLKEENKELSLASVSAQAKVEDMEKSKVALTHLANHDYLTNLPNRLQLKERIDQAISFAERHSTKLAVLFLDLDRFKAINDTLGHAFGDLLLQEVARRLREVIRRSDTVSRQGGDEFVLLLSDLNEHQNLGPKIKKIIDAVSAPYEILDAILHIGVSIGVSLFPDHGTDSKSLIKCADKAMYHVKENGRNHYRIYDHRMRDDHTDTCVFDHSDSADNEAQLKLF